MTALLFAVALGQSALPRPGLQKGQEIVFQVNMVFSDVKESDLGMRQEWRLAFKSTDKGTVGSRKLLKMQVDGQDIKLDKVEEEHWTESRDSRGMPITRSVANDGDMEKRRWIRLFDISFPAASLRKGSTWTTVDDFTELPRLSSSYTVENLDDDYLTIKFSRTESGQSGRTTTGTARCDKRTGWPRDMRGTIDRYTFPDDEERRTYRVEYTVRQTSR
ncbi:MAG: hypothetical protein JSS65_06580 [Armatimonadetes bacterium]|nr:hypothetical protein [Armatimonadota bacterium]